VPPKWLNKSSVSDKEIVGRRVFGPPFEQRPSAKIPQGAFRLDIFMESRAEAHLSLDRLGLRAADANVLAELSVLCREHAGRVKKPFTGWAGLRVIELSNLRIVPSEDVVYADRNPYHADLLLDDYRNRSQMESLCFRLAWQAQRVGLVAPPSLVEPQQSTADQADARTTVLGWLRAAWRFLKSW
jgi:hypothetical protein